MLEVIIRATGPRADTFRLRCHMSVHQNGACMHIAEAQVERMQPAHCMLYRYAFGQNLVGVEVILVPGRRSKPGCAGRTGVSLPAAVQASQVPKR